MTTILLFGDSNTYGSMPMVKLDDGRRYERGVCWSGRLARALGPAVEVITEGLPGRTTVHDDPVEGAHRNGFTILPALLESHAPLDLVVIMLGTNDFKARFSVTALDVALSVERLSYLVRASGTGPKGAAPRLLLVAPPSLVETGCLEGMFSGGAAKSRKLADELAQVAARQKAAFFDAGAHVEVSPVDGVHFEPEAHAILGTAMAEVIRPLIGQ